MLSVMGTDLVLEAESLASQRRYDKLHGLLSSVAEAVIETDPLLRFYMILSSLQTGDLAAARRQSEEAFDYFAQYQPSRLFYRYLNVAGIVATHLGELDSAASLFARVYDLASRARDLQLAADANMNLGVVYDIRGDWDLALSSQSRALATFSVLGDFQMVAGCQHNIGMTCRQLGLLESARAAFEIAVDLYGRYGTPDSVIGTLLERIVLCLRMGETAMAEVLLRSAEVELATTKNRKLAAEAVRVRGLVAARKGDLDDAFSHLAHAEASAAELGSVLLRAEATAGMAEIQRLRGDEAERARLLEITINYYRQIGADRRAAAVEESPSYFG